MIQFLSSRRTVLSVLLFLSLSISCIAQETAPAVQDITATPESPDAITVSWAPAPFFQEHSVIALLVYRDTKPIDSAQVLETLTPAAELAKRSVSYRDVPPDFRDYYYAVIPKISGETLQEDGEALYYDEETDGLPQDVPEGTLHTVIVPGVNATVTGTHREGKSQPVQDVQQAAKRTARSDRRRQPLPYIDMLGETYTEQQITPEAELAAKTLLTGTDGTTAAKKELEPHIFSEDEVSPGGGDDYLLYDLLQSSFNKKKYTDAAKRLERFLAQNRDEAVTRRAYFYLGESYYYKKEYSHALQQFLKVKDAYPTLSARWIDSCLNLYQIKQ